MREREARREIEGKWTEGGGETSRSILFMEEVGTKEQQKKCAGATFSIKPEETLVSTESSDTLGYFGRKGAQEAAGLRAFRMTN